MNWPLALRSRRITDEQVAEVVGDLPQRLLAPLADAVKNALVIHQHGTSNDGSRINVTLNITVNIRI